MSVLLLLATASAADVVARLPATLTPSTWSTDALQSVSSVTVDSSETVVITEDGREHLLPTDHPLHGASAQAVLDHYAAIDGRLSDIDAMLSGSNLDASAPLLDESAFVNTLMGTQFSGDGRSTLAMDLAILQLSAGELLLDTDALAACLQTEPDNMLTCIETEPDELQTEPDTMIACSPDVSEADGTVLSTEADWVAAVYGIVSPRDAATGLPTGIALQAIVDDWHAGLLSDDEVTAEGQLVLDTAISIPDCEADVVSLVTQGQTPY